jgi:hypothetical protein
MVFLINQLANDNGITIVEMETGKDRKSTEKIKGEFL